MGPEAALLSARFAEYQSTRVFGRLESPREDPIYVAASVRSHFENLEALRREPRRPRFWARVFRVLRRSPVPELRSGKDAPRALASHVAAEIVPVEGGPVVATPRAFQAEPWVPDEAPGLDRARFGLAGMPFRWEGRQ